MLKLIVASVLLLLLFAPLAETQTQFKPAGAMPVEKTPASPKTIDVGWGDPHQRLEQEMVARSVSERQSQLRQDTEKLLTLAAELKQNVDKTSVNILSMDVIKKAQEIEKLAKSVKDKMRNAY